MNRATFFEKFDQFASEPSAAKKMRELVLQLAVRGELVGQNPKDEPASKAIEKLVAQNGTGRNAKSLADEESADLPFAVPASWKWVRFGDLVRIRTGKLDANAAVEGGEYPFFTCSKTPSQISTYSFDTSAVILAGNGDFNLKSYSGKFDAYQRTYVIEPLGWELGFCFWLISAQIKRITDNQRGSAIPYLRLGDIADPLVPFPPLAEQKRIVAKVDELMALCDRLEAQQKERETLHATLARASLARFSDAPTLANLHFIFHKSYAIFPADLRKSILTLAFVGKLVSQNPNDEPASVLLEKARTEKARLIEAGLVKKEPWADKLKDATTLYELPSGWEWTHVSDVVEKVTVGFVGSMKAEYREGGVPFLRCQNVRVNRYEPIGLTFVSKEFHRSISKSTLRPGDVVVTRSGNVGVTCVIPDSLPEANCSDLVIVKRPLALIPAFLSYFINSIALGQIEAKTVGIALTHFNTQSVAQLTVALPPLAEQRRIVSKVEQLMALVDALETQLADSREKGQKLLEAVVSEFTLTS